MTNVPSENVPVHPQSTKPYFTPKSPEGHRLRLLPPTSFLTASMEEMVTAARELEETAEHLGSLVTRFKLG